MHLWHRLKFAYLMPLFSLVLLYGWSSEEVSSCLSAALRNELVSHQKDAAPTDSGKEDWVLREKLPFTTSLLLLAQTAELEEMEVLHRRCSSPQSTYLLTWKREHHQLCQVEELEKCVRYNYVADVFNYFSSASSQLLSGNFVSVPFVVFHWTAVLFRREMTSYQQVELQLLDAYARDHTLPEELAEEAAKLRERHAYASDARCYRLASRLAALHPEVACLLLEQVSHPAWVASALELQAQIDRHEKREFRSFYGFLDVVPQPEPAEETYAEFLSALLLNQGYQGAGAGVKRDVPEVAVADWLLSSAPEDASSLSRHQRGNHFYHRLAYYHQTSHFSPAAGYEAAKKSYNTATWNYIVTGQHQAPFRGSWKRKFNSFLNCVFVPAHVWRALLSGSVPNPSEEQLLATGAVCAHRGCELQQRELKKLGKIARRRGQWQAAEEFFRQAGVFNQKFEHRFREKQAEQLLLQAQRSADREEKTALLRYVAKEFPKTSSGKRAADELSKLNTTSGIELNLVEVRKSPVLLAILKFPEEWLDGEGENDELIDLEMSGGTLYGTFYQKPRRELPLSAEQELKLASWCQEREYLREREQQVKQLTGPPFIVPLEVEGSFGEAGLLAYPRLRKMPLP